MDSMRIATFNANSIRLRLDDLLDWMAVNEPDVVALQEIKCEEDKFPAEAFAEVGYLSAIHGQKGRHGVATVSRLPMTHVEKHFQAEVLNVDSRIVTVTVEGVRVINTYVPNGTTVGSEKWSHKLAWFDAFRDYLHAQVAQYKNVIWLGDINIARQPEDVFDSKKVLGGVGHHPDEFVRLDSVLESGMTDMFRKFEPGAGHFSFWEFMNVRAYRMNLGWRIDHIYATPELAEKCERCWIDRALRDCERPSDHTVVTADFAL